MEQQRETNPRAGWSLRPWCASADISPATYYNLPEQVRPRSVKIGKRRIIVEPPDAWLRRMAEAEAAR